jgi:DNA-binding CsgD family transcriptional regulator
MHEPMLANLRAHREAGDLRGVVTSLAGIGATWTPADHATSAYFLRDGLLEAQRIGYWQGEAVCVLGIVGTAAVAGFHGEALRLNAALGPHLEVIRAHLPHHYFEQYTENIRLARGDRPDDGDRVASAAAVHWPQIRLDACTIASRLGADNRLQSGKLSLQPSRRRGPAFNPDLTEREKQILAAIAAGKTNPQIASQFELSPKTVMHHSGNIYRKLGVRGRAEAIAHAYRTATVGSSLR